MTTPAGRCGQCNQTLPLDTPSLYFCDYWCQRRWYMVRLASDADRRLADASIYTTSERT